MRRYTIGIDVGGTNAKLGLVDQKGRLVYATGFKTREYTRNKKNLIDALSQGISILIKRNNINIRSIKGIGIGLPGLIDAQHGIVRELTNIAGWRNVPLKNILTKKFRVPVAIDNDVNVITLAEWQYGAGRGMSDLVCLTLGTGVGGGLILNNALYRGPGYAAGEIGHIPLNERGPSCACGGYGCLECAIGNIALARRAKKIFEKKTITLEDITKRAARGDKKACVFWNDVGLQLGGVLAGVANLLNPQGIIIGGGITGAYRFLSSGVKSAIRTRAMTVQGRMVTVKKAQLGSNAGIIGAHVLVSHI